MRAGGGQSHSAALAAVRACSWISGTRSGSGRVIVGDQNITLPCELLSELMNVSKMTISRYRRWAIIDG